FFPFCKTDSGLDHYRCQLKTASWQYFPEKQEMIFTISANRFLRGMVRLIVGACVQTAQGQMQLADIKNAMDQQTMLRKSLSAPPQGLFLTKVDYSF
ncbi:MAG: tRNA pseudouridine(38-40) synthase TruA, partial [Saprospiraceae bacterium]|nr:tRNA pseudouridine(38-40) synthase TruA [Saprospiraceae bacterium]